MWRSVYNQPRLSVQIGGLCCPKTLWNSRSPDLDTQQGLEERRSRAAPPTTRDNERLDLRAASTIPEAARYKSRRSLVMTSDCVSFRSSDAEGYVVAGGEMASWCL